MPDDAGPAEADVSGGMSDSENEHEYYDAPIKEEDDKMTEQNAASDGVDANGEPKKKYDPKDPLRPRRKKARRACYACQRAHLTCGKRGISSLIWIPQRPVTQLRLPGFLSTRLLWVPGLCHSNDSVKVWRRLMY